MDKYYKVVVNDFMLTGGDKYDFSNAKNVNETYIPIRDGLVDAIKEAKVITPQPADYLIEVSEAEVAKPAPAPAPAEEKSYTVKAGDVLWKIAKKFGTTWQRLAEYNKLKNPHLIFPGQKILVPAN